MEQQTFGQYLRSLRSKKGTGLRTASRELKISPSYLSKIEQDHIRPPTTKILAKFSKYYGVDLEYLISLAIKRRYSVILKIAKNESNQAELFALYRAVQEIEPNLMFQLLKEVYASQDKTEDELKADLQRLRSQLPRLSKGKEGLLADKFTPRYLSKKILEKMAEKTLAKLGLTPEYYNPPTPIEKLADDPGRINLVLTEQWDGKHMEDEPSVLGMSRWSRKYPGERDIVVSAKLFESPQSYRRARLNFTLAHEYFHVIEHLPLMRSYSTADTLMRKGVLLPQLSPSMRKIKPSIRKMKLRCWVNDTSGPRRLSTDEDWREWQAGYFAAFLLMPPIAIRKEFRDRFERDYLETPCDMNKRQYALEVATTLITPNYVCDRPLCSIFDVSAQAMAIRLLQLGIVI